MASDESPMITAAKALYNEYKSIEHEFSSYQSWEDLDPDAQQCWIQVARAAIKAYNAA